ncbi:GAF domain-containing protein [Larkinella rosea]|uniref:GAF domain-containing protein n=1 Tax=Larkinella rosea TaxID=2025312 RepID=A0A3P1C1U6_9BACT|nr:GAF domain-containing protein [Larkinella rosea]RRB06774.1 GAF domain-containing protein [Larkinella rosea]
MKTAPLPANETERLQALESYHLIDSIPESVYENITHLASEICRTPMSLIGLIEKDRQWFKAQRGMKGSETPRELTFCSHAILNPDEAFIVPDARLDDRFHDNPFTLKDPHVVFYAGVPLVNLDGYPLGTLCVIDRRPRILTDNQIISLKALAKWVASEFELRKAKADLEKSQHNLETARLEMMKAKNALVSGVLPLAQEVLHTSESLLDKAPRADQIDELKTLWQTGQSLLKLNGR